MLSYTQVDLVLLGGDLFHDNKPSRTTLFKSMELLRKFCMGDRPCAVQVLNTPESGAIHSPSGLPNYEDPNYNVDLPIFSIHGNHDDPSGSGGVSVRLRGSRPAAALWGAGRRRPFPALLPLATST